MPRGFPKAGFRIRNGKRIEVTGMRWKHSKANQDAQTLDLAVNVPAPIETEETDQQIHDRLESRFGVLKLMTKAAFTGKTRSLIVTGPAGLSKSYTVEQVCAEIDPEGNRVKFCKGFTRSTGLYKALYQQSEEGKVTVFDDCDSVFMDEDTLNILKTACDTTERRRLFWGAETKMMDDDGETYLPTSFDFNGSVVFITNFDMDAAVRNGHRLATHFTAMISRAHYIDLGIKTVRDYIIQIKRVVYEDKMLDQRGLNPDQQKLCMDYVFDNAPHLRELTLRVVIKVGDMIIDYPDRWKEIADVTVKRPDFTSLAPTTNTAIALAK